MNRRRSRCSDYIGQYVYNSTPNYQKLTNLLIKQRNKGSIQNIHQYKSQKNGYQQIILQHQHKSNYQHPQSKAQLGRTRFNINFVEKLKRQRKRQQKRKNYSKMLKQDISCQKRQQQVNSNQYSLPIVKRTLDQLINYQKSKDKYHENKMTLTTINLTDNERKAKSTFKFSKKRAFSLQEREQDQTVEDKQQNQFNQKVQQILNQIKKNRNKQNKNQDLINNCLGDTTVYLNKKLQTKNNNIELPIIKLKQVKKITYKDYQIKIKDIQPWNIKDKPEQRLTSLQDGIQNFII